MENLLTTLPSPEPYYSMTRCGGDLRFLSGFGPVQNRVLIGETIEEYTFYTMDDAACGRGLVMAGAAWLSSIVARIPWALGKDRETMMGIDRQRILYGL